MHRLQDILLSVSVKRKRGEERRGEKRREETVEVLTQGE
jgi:hypothetical protein